MNYLTHRPFRVRVLRFSLKAGETLFMTKDKKVTMVNHNETSKVLHVMLDDNTSEMFELLELVVKK